MKLNYVPFPNSCVIALCTTLLLLFNLSQTALADPIPAEARGGVGYTFDVLESLSALTEVCLPSSVQYMWAIEFDFDETFDGQLTVTISCTPDGSNATIELGQKTPCEPVGDVEIIDGKLALNGGHLECTFPAINPIVEQALEKFDFELPETIEYSDFVWWVDYDPVQIESLDDIQLLIEEVGEEDVVEEEETIVQPDTAPEDENNEGSGNMFDFMLGYEDGNNEDHGNIFGSMLIGHANEFVNYLTNFATNSLNQLDDVMSNLLYADLSTVAPTFSAVDERQHLISPTDEVKFPVIDHPSFSLGLNVDPQLQNEGATHIYTVFDEQNKFEDRVPSDFNTTEQLRYGGSLQNIFFAHAIEDEYVGINQIDPLTFSYSLGADVPFTIGIDSEGNILKGTLDNLYIDPPVFINLN